MTNEQLIVAMFQANSTVTRGDVARALNISPEFAGALLSAMSGQGKIARVARGVYGPAENPVAPASAPARDIQGRRHGEGTRKCKGITERSTRCGNQEIEGLEFCLKHVPDEYLEEAEDVTGIRRCRHNFGQPGACRNYAVENTSPPCCSTHGANLGGNQRAGAISLTLEQQAAERLAQILAENGEKLIYPEAVADPLSELLDLAAEMKAGKELLRQVTSYLYSKDRIRYAHSKVGEQLRMEILLYERSLERFAKILIDISKLKIEDRLAGVREQTAAMLERALDMALEDSGVGIEGKHKARESFRRHLKVVA